MTYVLILTLFYNGGLSIQAVPMADRPACGEAAKTWARMLQDEFGKKAKWTAVCSPNVAAEVKPQEQK